MRQANLRALRSRIREDGEEEDEGEDDGDPMVLAEEEEGEDEGDPMVLAKKEDEDEGDPMALTEKQVPGRRRRRWQVTPRSQGQTTSSP